MRFILRLQQMSTVFLMKSEGTCTSIFFVFRDFIYFGPKLQAYNFPPSILEKMFMNYELSQIK